MVHTNIPMLGEQVTSWADVTPGRLYVVHDDGGETPVGAVQVTGVDEETVYGVDYQTGERVVLRPITGYIEQRRLTRVDADSSLPAALQSTTVQRSQ